MDNKIFTDIENLIKQEYHMLPGYIYADLRKQHALTSFKNNKELKGICSLCESHAPYQKLKASYRYAKQASENCPKSLNTEYLCYNCPLASFDEQIDRMIDKVGEMPKEWTIVQLTAQYNIEECKRSDLSKIYTNPLHISVFNCGQSILQPFNINIDVPRDPLGNPIELCREMNEFMEKNKSVLNTSSDLKKYTIKDKLAFHEDCQSLEKRITELVDLVQEKWLSEWRCLLIGKCTNTKIEEKVMTKVNEVLKEDTTGFELSSKVQYLLSKITLASEYLNKNEIVRAVKHCIPDHKDIRHKIINTILETSNSFQMKKIPRHPVLLIIDEKLDCIPWEMIDVLMDHPVSRMPSLDFTYALFKEHEQTIVNGYKHIDMNGSSYITNPGLDLKKMEARLKLFCNYWIPEWKGMLGQTPTSEEFIEYLTSGGIFMYNGHGSGVQYVPGGKIQQIRLNSVVLLFGCSSLRKQENGPLVGMHDLFYCYLIACSPCVLGMLWNVSDFDTDLLSTDLISFWVPSKAATHWKHIDKLKWDKGHIVPLTTTQILKCKAPLDSNEPELLRAMKLAKGGRARYITRAALVAKGLPVKIVT